ncbi:MAG TPA: FkbM family methyltransferase, partial [Bacteroidia bacterium]|nr:FkbM family methyltransferase [Bacteroidia bacterium]
NYELVDIVKLDDFVKDKQIPKIDLIKIDTEGFEINVLKGAEETLKKNMPILFIEVDNDHLMAQHSSAKDLITYIKSLGYEITADRTGKLVSPSDDLNNCHFDIICKAPKS